MGKLMATEVTKELLLPSVCRLVIEPIGFGFETATTIITNKRPAKDTDLI